MQWLSQQPLVHFVSPVPRATTNNLYAGITSEAGSLSSSMKIDPEAAANTPFWRMGLDGTGQVILALSPPCAPHLPPFKGGLHTSAVSLQHHILPHPSTCTHKQCITQVPVPVPCCASRW